MVLDAALRRRTCEARLESGRGCAGVPSSGTKSSDDGVHSASAPARDGQADELGHQPVRVRFPKDLARYRRHYEHRGRISRGTSRISGVRSALCARKLSSLPAGSSIMSDATSTRDGPPGCRLLSTPVGADLTETASVSDQTARWLRPCSGDGKGGAGKANHPIGCLPLLDALYRSIEAIARALAARTDCAYCTSTAGAMTRPTDSRNGVTEQRRRLALT
jgi:hypothetical protein